MANRVTRVQAPVLAQIRSMWVSAVFAVSWATPRANENAATNWASRRPESR